MARLALRAFFFCLLGLPALAQPVAVQVDGSPVRFDQPPVVRGGRVLVPLRGVFERLGADVVYIPRNGQVRATKGSTMIELASGRNSAVVDGRSVLLDSPPESRRGRILVPLRFVSQALGADVRWNAATKMVTITSGAPAPPVVAVPPPAPSVLGLRLLAPTANERVSPHFRLVAQTEPGATLEVTMQILPPDSPPGRLVHMVAHADPQGQVAIPIHLHAPRNSRLILSATSVDASGRRSQPEQVSAVRGQ